MRSVSTIFLYMWMVQMNHICTPMLFAHTQTLIIQNAKLTANGIQQAVSSATSFHHDNNTPARWQSGESSKPGVPSRSPKSQNWPQQLLTRAVAHSSTMQHDENNGWSSPWEGSHLSCRLSVQIRRRIVSSRWRRELHGLSLQTSSLISHSCVDLLSGQVCPVQARRTNTIWHPAKTKAKQFFSKRKRRKKNTIILQDPEPPFLGVLQRHKHSSLQPKPLISCEIRKKNQEKEMVWMKLGKLRMKEKDTQTANFVKVEQWCQVFFFSMFLDSFFFIIIQINEGGCKKNKKRKMKCWKKKKKNTQCFPRPWQTWTRTHYTQNIWAQHTWCCFSLQSV